MTFVVHSSLFKSTSYYSNADRNGAPTAIDWREKGVVTGVRSQGNCGACWAISAVETMESAYAIKHGELIDLCETEVIVCEDDSSMCYGGWPQNAYDFAMEKGGLLMEGSTSLSGTYSLAYYGDWLAVLSMTLAGSDAVDESLVEDYLQDVCLDSYGRENGKSHSSDSGEDTRDRYGDIQGYGYTTYPCLCYTNGQGCGCDKQDEELAMENLATYGPATVCFTASDWYDYAGGIITTESIGCTSEFTTMNHWYVSYSFSLYCVVTLLYFGVINSTNFYNRHNLKINAGNP